MNELATNYPTSGGWNGWWRGRRRRGEEEAGELVKDAEEGGGGKWRSWWRGCRKRERGGSGGVSGGDVEEEGEEEAGELVVEERGAIYGGGGAVGLDRGWLLSVCEL